MRRRTAAFILGGVLVSLLLAGVVSNFAAGTPDGLDSASTKGCTLNADGEIIGGDCIARQEKDHELNDSPLADYGIRGVDNTFVSTGLSGMAGVLLTFALGGGIFWLARRRGPTPNPANLADPADATASPGPASPGPPASADPARRGGGG